MAKKKPIEQYDHRDKERINNPPVGLVTLETDRETGKKTYAYDPHLDPQLVWAGKAEHTSFEVPTVSLHVHERIDPRTIIEAVRKRNGASYEQTSFFHLMEENPPLREAIEFYKHRHNWSNRLIAGDSLLVMNSLIEKEGMAGQVQMIYIDPPYGIRYGSNFQPFVNKRDVKDGKDEDLTAEPEMIKAFRDTWELGIHSYLTYLRDRLLLARELLSESGSIFVQISDENVHLVRNLMDEVFGAGHFVGMISYKVTGGTKKAYGLPQTTDFLLWYARENQKIKFLRIFLPQELDTSIFSNVEERNGTRRPLTDGEKQNQQLVKKANRFFSTLPMHSKGTGNNSEREFNNKMWSIPTGMHWRHSDEGFARLVRSNRVIESKSVLRSIAFFDDFPYVELTSNWNDTGPEINKDYVVQTAEIPIQRCLLMTTDPGDLVLDITCGSGTTAYVAEHWGRRWITCDTSRVALTLAKQRLMTASYDYYELAHPEEGVSSGFKYKTVPHITLKSIANNEPPAQETLYDQPFVDNSKSRVSGPFTVEAVPAPVVKPLTEIAEEALTDDESISRSGETLRQAEWRDELLKTGIRGKRGQYIIFSRVEPLPGTRWLHADAETKPNDRGADSVRETRAIYEEPQRVVISFGPEHAPLEQRQVALAIEEAQLLVPKPKIILFAAFQFDPEAAKDIDGTDWPGVTLLKAQMNADLFTEDLKRKRVSNESFWLIGQPDVRLERISEGKDKGKYQVEVLGFDYYNTKTGSIESGGTANIAIWLLDTDYDGRSLFPRQVFFPMAAEKEGWSRLARNLKAEIDEELIEAYRGTVSLPFDPGENRRVVVKIVDDRGIESLKIIEVE
ncbi:site-specific DNA-methyltransferase [Dehalococcoidia bacterium]|nr:site-specific DNA-methyltransferase [Dehalococcoidia bacterium]